MVLFLVDLVTEAENHIMEQILPILLILNSQAEQYDCLQHCSYAN